MKNGLDMYDIDDLSAEGFEELKNALKKEYKNISEIFEKIKKIEMIFKDFNYKGDKHEYKPNPVRYLGISICGVTIHDDTKEILIPQLIKILEEELKSHYSDLSKIINIQS